MTIQVCIIRLEERKIKDFQQSVEFVVLDSIAL